LRIGIDIRSLIFTQAGISHNLYNLISYLSQFPEDSQYFLFTSGRTNRSWPKNVKEIVIRWPHLSANMEKIWEEIFLPLGLIFKKIELFHGPRFMIPRACPCKTVVTIHDLGFKIMPECIINSAYIYFDSRTKLAVSKADRIIAVSENTKNDLIKLYNASEDKITVIHWGIDQSFQPCNDRSSIGRIKNKLGIDKEFILFVGTIEPRKNLVRLIKAFDKLKMKREYRLVIAGCKGWLYEEVFATVKELNMEKDIIFTGYVHDNELPFLYSAAELFICPSLYEGFGLPVLEAMACGVSVVTSNVSSLPEVAGDAAILVDPYDVEAIAKAMEQVLEDSNLRKEMIEKGFERAEKFSWQDTVKKTLDVYKQVCL